MSENNRKLPLWMVKSDDHHRSDTVKKEKKTRGPTNKAAKRRLKRVAIYWMNERELLETALGFLTDNETSTRDELSAPEEQVVIPETDDDGSPYSSVSSVAEQQTVPYTNLPREKADDRVKPSCDAPDSSPKPDVDDEALELVREIFFT